MGSLPPQPVTLRDVWPSAVPGAPMPHNNWQARHRALTLLLLIHAAAVPVWAVLNGSDVGHAFTEGAALAGFALLGRVAHTRTLAAAAVSLGLVLGAALVVHAGDGLTVLHFHFFFVVAALALYQQWLPFALAVAFVLVDHGVMGLLAPEDVYDDAFGLAHPWRAVAVHGGYVLVAAAMGALAWTWSQREREEAEQRAEAEAAKVRESERHLSALLDHAPSSVYVKDLDGRFVRVNAAFCDLLGRSADELVGATSHELFGPEVGELVREHDRRVLVDGVPVNVDEDVPIHGESRTFNTVKFPLRDEVGKPYALAGISTDVTNERVARAQLEHQATHDDLTGLPNRTFLHDRVSRALERPNALVAVVFLDLDGFKEVNDSLGHDAGDELLTVVAARLGPACPRDATLARIGGDEFVVCLPDVPDGATAFEAAQRLLAALRDPVVVAERRVDVRASAGVACGRGQEGASAMLLLRDADTALYAAKAAGRDRAALFVPEMRESDERRRRLEGDLLSALGTGQGLFLEFQPIADERTHAVVGVEALVRWRHPTDGVLAPDEFLPLAERRGLLGLLDRWVLEQACATAVGWASAVRLTINMSPATVNEPGLAAWVAETCSRTSFPPQRLVVELTETAVVEHPAQTSAVLEELRALGVRIALDDFGTGFSSLALLRELPVDVVKIDRSFTEALADSERDAAIVRATVALAEALGAFVVAEGVETAEQRAAVVAAGCRHVQGFLISRPLPADALQAMLGAALPFPREADDPALVDERAS